jgi:hypothetical protein
MNFVNMAFSPDAHYFIVGDRSYGYTSLGGFTTEKAVAFDLKLRQSIPLKADLKKLGSSLCGERKRSINFLRSQDFRKTRSVVIR